MDVKRTARLGRGEMLDSSGCILILVSYQESTVWHVYVLAYDLPPTSDGRRYARALAVREVNLTAGDEAHLELAAAKRGDLQRVVAVRLDPEALDAELGVLHVRLLHVHHEQLGVRHARRAGR